MVRPRGFEPLTYSFGGRKADFEARNQWIRAPQRSIRFSNQPV